MQHKRNDEMITDTERVLQNVFHMTPEHAKQGAGIYTEIITRVKEFNPSDVHVRAFNNRLTVELTFDLD